MFRFIFINSRNSKIVISAKQTEREKKEEEGKEEEEEKEKEEEEEMAERPFIEDQR